MRLHRRANAKKCRLFLLMSAPYVLGIVFVASTWEIRLWTPVWLALIVLGADADPIINLYTPR